MNKHVYKSYSIVRNAQNVRLSPSVDHLWIRNSYASVQQIDTCGKTGPSCVRRRLRLQVSPPIHDTPGAECTVSPQGRTAVLRSNFTVLHTFPSTDDDDYLDNPIEFHINCGGSEVDNSRTLSTLTFEGGPS